MIARSALPFSVGDILDRVRRCSIRLWQHLAAGFGLDGGSGSQRWQRVFEAYGDWSSLVGLARDGGTRWRDYPQSFRRFCESCEEDTVNEELDEFGPGWYAQICRCRRCGREDMRIWPLACW